MREVEKALRVANAAVSREEWAEAERALAEVQDRVGRLLREVALKPTSVPIPIAEPPSTRAERLENHSTQSSVSRPRKYVGSPAAEPHHLALVRSAGQQQAKELSSLTNGMCADHKYDTAKSTIVRNKQCHRASPGGTKVLVDRVRPELA
jgi:hypothetical protein